MVKLKDLEKVTDIYDKIKVIESDINELKKFAEEFLGEGYGLDVSLRLIDLAKKQESEEFNKNSNVTYDTLRNAFTMSYTPATNYYQELNQRIGEVDKLKLITFLINLKIEEKDELIKQLNTKYKIK